jgi:hypothetical protein
VLNRAALLAAAPEWMAALCQALPPPQDPAQTQAHYPALRLVVLLAPRPALLLAAAPETRAALSRAVNLSPPQAQTQAEASAARVAAADR